jgi:hypothetical protein
LVVALWLFRQAARAVETAKACRLSSAPRKDQILRFNRLSPSSQPRGESGSDWSLREPNLSVLSGTPTQEGEERSLVLKRCIELRRQQACPQEPLAPSGICCVVDAPLRQLGLRRLSAATAKAGGHAQPFPFGLCCNVTVLCRLRGGTAVRLTYSYPSLLHFVGLDQRRHDHF